MKILKAILNIDRLLWISLLILLVGLTFVLQRRFSKCEDGLGNVQRQNNILCARIDSLTSLRTRYRELLEIVTNLDSLQLEQLKRTNLSNSESDVITNLSKHNELIPFKGVLGGTMGFYAHENIILISNCAFAPFEDGHIGGYMLLEYQVANDGKISWKVIDAYLK